MAIACQRHSLALLYSRVFSTPGMLTRAAAAETTQVANLWSARSPAAKEEEQQKSSAQPRPTLPALPAMFSGRRMGVHGFAAQRFMSTKGEGEVEPALSKPTPGKSTVPVAVGSLVGLYVYWSLGGVDWIVTLNTGFVQAAVWITALSLVSPSSLWSNLKTTAHIESEASERGAQSSSAIKII